MNHRTGANPRRLRVPAILAAASALLLAVTACSSATPTLNVIYTTPTPVPTAPPTPIVILVTPTPTAAPTDTPAAPATPTAVPSPTPPSSPAPSGSPGPASACSGSSDPVHGADNQAFWTGAANVLPFSVYCGIVPGGWFFNGGSYTQPNGGHLQAKYSYKASSGPSVVMDEGVFTASTHGSSLGSAKFGDLSGTLYAGSSSGYVLLVNPGSSHAYQAVGTGVTQAAFVSITAALMKVVKS